jgi:hypothetical protein
MPVTGKDEVVPATRWTGEERVAPLAGVQIVTEGFTVLKGHGAADKVTQVPSTRKKANKDDRRG